MERMPTAGEKLRAAREARKLSIEKVVQATRIRSYYIEAMEADDLSVMPSAVQARGFLRAYVEFLGLDMETLFQAKESASILEPAIQPEPEPEIQQEEDLQATQQAQDLEDTPETEELVDENKQAGEPQPSDIIFRQIGVSLRQRRELLGLTLDEIERHTRIRQANLKIVEQGNFDLLPSPVQARGMLNTYANFLDMNGDAMLLRFTEGLQARRVERQASLPVRRQRWALPVWLQRLFSPDLIFGSLLIISLASLALWGASRIIANQESLEDEPQAPSISDVLLENPQLETPTPEAIPTGFEESDIPLPSLQDDVAAPLEPESEVALPPPGSSILQVNLFVRERVFLRVIVDGEIQQDGRVAPGAALVFNGLERIEVLTGNGNAVQVIYNQFDFGTMGNPGEVVNRIYTLDGIQTPTPTVSPTASNTPRFQPTATPTITGTPTISEIP